MALLLWAKKQPYTLFAATVDHQKRHSSMFEALQVHHWCTRHNIKHTILIIDKTTTPSDAREARYEALSLWYEKHNLDALLLGHHQQDQAETLLLRLQRGSGLKGLGCMHEYSCNYKMQLWRPLLEYEPDTLRQWLMSANQPWFEDPSNQQSNQDRNTLRPLLAKTSNKRLAATCQHLQRAQEAIDFYSNAFIEQHCQLTDNRAVIDRLSFENLPQEVAFRVLTSVIEQVSGIKKPLRFERLLNIYINQHIIESSGCRFKRSEQTIIITSL